MSRLAAIEATLDEALQDALKARFATIATNALTQTPNMTDDQIRRTLINLKDTHALACKIAGEVFT